MSCSRCGAKTTSEICPRCDARQSPRGGAGWFITVGRSNAGTTGLTGTVRSYIRRTWGEHGHIQRGERWEPGEHEVYRCELPCVSVFAVDRHTTVAQQAKCLLTDRSLVILDQAGACLQIHLSDIRAARPHREYDFELGFSCWIALNRMGSDVHDPKGDICLYCKNERQSIRLTALVREMLP